MAENEKNSGDGEPNSQAVSRGTWGTALLVTLVLAGCASRAPAPVVIAERTTSVQKAAPPGGTAETRPEYYTVKQGDTLYSIALNHGQDYRELAVWNSLPDPNKILAGQQLRVLPPGTAAAVGGPVDEAGVVTRPIALPGTAIPSTTETRPIGRPVDGVAAPSAKVESGAVSPPKSEPAGAPLGAAPSGGDATSDEPVDWGWPSSGKLIGQFNDTSNKGLDLGGRVGDPVLAAGTGRVVYTGESLRGYGKLVIIKHNSTYLSAYAHNNAILVKEGQNVTKGQKIAELGSTHTDSPKLHFEIRRQGKPTDPMKYLPAR